MTDKREQFLNDICSRVKYKTIHRHIRQEVSENIYETAKQYEKSGFNREMSVDMAISHMYSAEQIGNEYNKKYRIPFNCRFGLGIWAAVVTMVFYLIYPLFYKLYKDTIQTGYNTPIIIVGLLLFAVVNYIFLRRGKLKISIRDFIEIIIGFFVGWVLVIAGLTEVSAFGKFGAYPYFKDVNIPFSFPYVPFLPKNSLAFAIEFFSWWFCMLIYLIAARYSSKTKSLIRMVLLPNSYLDREKDDNTRRDI